MVLYPNVKYFEYMLMILPVILAGGSGERLWPLSRSSYPKQFLNLFDSEHSLFQSTVLRLPQNSEYLAPLIICHEEYRFIVAEQLRQIQRSNSGIILEPCARNTAPAIALAAHWALQHYPECVLLVLPADHLISDTSKLQQNVSEATLAAQQDSVVTFGIPIDKPETGYGYIEVGSNSRINKFIEKPDLATAQSFVNNSNYLWNSGMFCFKPSLYLQELETYAPLIVKHSKDALKNFAADLDFTRVATESYAQCPSISIDYAVMEHTDKAIVLALQSTWSDVGSWNAVWEQGGKDADANYITGDVVAHNSSNCLLNARHRLLATINVHNLAIVETSDAVLVADKSQVQEIRQLVAKLKFKQHTAVNEHRKVMRPWGWYDSITKGAGFQVKLICVLPGRSLSLQSHKYRSEHWVVVNGKAKVIRGDDTMYLQENESTFIPLGVKHQLSNCGDTPLELIEVQSGSYLGEDDIIRYADEHGRAVNADAE